MGRAVGVWSTGHQSGCRSWCSGRCPLRHRFLLGRDLPSRLLPLDPSVFLRTEAAETRQSTPVSGLADIQVGKPDPGRFVRSAAGKIPARTADTFVYGGTDLP